MRPQIVSDDAKASDLELEPEGWFDGAQDDLDHWLATYGEDDDDGSG